jgi:hypothetical protein
MVVVPGATMSAPPSPPAASEDRTHRYVLVLACAAAAAVLLRPIDPSERLPGTSGLGQASRAGSPPPDVALDELQAAIGRLERWVTASYEQAQNPFERVLGVQGLGRSKANLEHQALVACLRDWSPARAADHAAPPRPSALAAAAILLEAGVAPTERLTTGDGELRLQELVQQALDGQRDAPASDDASLAWQVQLLALALANGMTQYEDELAQKSELALGRLEREYRAFDVRQADSTLDPARVRELARARRDDPSAERERESALQLSAAVFFASGVSPHAALEGRVRRHLQALLLRHDLERAVYDVLMKESHGDQTEALRLHAFEQFGRLAQALFMAHVAWRQTPDEPFPAGLTPVMRQTARDLLVLFDQLERLGAFERPRDATHADEHAALVNAAVHALRGLRTARAAVRS